MRAAMFFCALAGAAACVPADRSVRAPVPASVAAAPLPAGAGADAVFVSQAGLQPPATSPSASPAEEPLAAEAQGGGDGSTAGDAAPGAAGEGPTWDIMVAPYESHERVEHYVRRYTGPAREWVTERLTRGTRYEQMIRAKLRDAGLPEDMYYLAFVESGFDTHAYSHAAAVGMWQFMASTGKGMGLRVDWWADERRDPVRATDAAVRFLASLHDRFGSLYLAAAAYNGGPTRVSRGLTRFADALGSSAGEDRYFALAEQDYLPRETKEYVPQIIAAALVGNDPERYGLDVEQRDVFAYDSVQVPPLTSLPAIARVTGASLATLRDLNPQFLRGITPPRIRSQVRIPAGTRARFDSLFSALPDSARSGVRRERVEKPGSLAVVARRLRTTPRGITTFNPNLKRTRKRNIAAGQTLFIPDADVAAAALDVPDPSIERGPGTRAKARRHTVRRGETLSHIARRYDTTVPALLRLNGLRKPLIRIGQDLAVPAAN